MPKHTTKTTHEHTINVALAEALSALGKTWEVSGEATGCAFTDSSRADVLVESTGGWPIILEAEVASHSGAEKDALAKLGKKLRRSSRVVETAVALVYPEAVRGLKDAALRSALETATVFEYCLFTVEPGSSAKRFPSQGFIAGGLRELALLLHRSSVPTWRAEALTIVLERGITEAEGDFTHHHATGSSVGKAIADALRQHDDAGGQTRKMAMAVVVNALVFQASLSEAGMLVLDPAIGGSRSAKSPSAFRVAGHFTPTPLMDEWDKILEVNYWPIFHTAKRIIAAMPSATQIGTLDTLWKTAETLVAEGVMKSHDLTGVIFQRLIADRKFLATYFTRPGCAALLAGLAMPLNGPVIRGQWGNAEILSQFRIGDFACGTGTLLSSAYQRMSLLHEVYKGDPRVLHPNMMRNGLVGLDVLNISVHLTAAMLAGSFPEVPFKGDCLLTMPYGVRDKDSIFLGSLELLESNASEAVFREAARTAGGRGEEALERLPAETGHGNFSLVIMNPPYTRHGAREGERSKTHNPAFAAFNATPAEQDQLAARMKKLGASGCGHGHAGIGSYFADLAHQKAAPGGSISLVLPLSAMSGSSWNEMRDLWRTRYSEIMVVTIGDGGGPDRSFSSDTDIAECLVIARKKTPGNTQRAMYMVLDKQPESIIEGELLAHALWDTVSAGGVRKLEDGPFGGTRVTLGESVVGELIDCPIPPANPWPVVGIADLTLAQTAHQLEMGRLWIAGMKNDPAHRVPIAMARIKDICIKIGPHHLDLEGSKIKPDGLPQGPFDIISGSPRGATYPCLWNHEASRERCMRVEPDSHGQIRSVGGTIPPAIISRAQKRWESASRVHYVCELRFNSQSLVVATTVRPSLGGRAWPTVVLLDANFDPAFALWCNSTLGLLCHWWMSNKSQAGRGTVTVTSIPPILTLDLRCLSSAQLSAAAKAFVILGAKRLLPFDQMDEDPVRAEIDRALLVDVLSLDPALCAPNGPMDLLRRKLAAEPQIHSDKKSRLVFTPTGEMSVRI